MKKFLTAFILLPMLILILPIIAALRFPRLRTVPAAAVAAVRYAALGGEPRISVLDVTHGRLSDVGMEEYLTGVLAGEMPAEYESEALRAQAVAARTYIMHKIGTSCAEHPDAVVCNNPAHCKAWLSDEDCAARWKGADAAAYREKLRRAVWDTRGEYMAYDGKPIEAVFFAMCGGRTESSAEIWGGERPYLKSVESRGDLDAPNLRSEVTVDNNRFCEIIRAADPAAVIDASAPNIGSTTRTEGGSVAEMEIGSRKFRGTQLRELFGLKSANFTLSQSGGNMVFSVTGNGHGVGMSQYGANRMAKEGKKYTEILAHYYSNIQIVKK